MLLVVVGVVMEGNGGGEFYGIRIREEGAIGAESKSCGGMVRGQGGCEGVVLFGWSFLGGTGVGVCGCVERTFWSCLLGHLLMVRLNV